MYTKAQLAALPDSELNRVAAEEFGLSVSTDINSKKAVVDAILAAQPAEPVEDVVVEEETVEIVEDEIAEDEIVEIVEDEIVEVAAKPVAKASKSVPKAPPKPKMFKIIIHNQEGPDASKFVKVQPNGIMYAIPREKEVVVPEIVVNVLNDAVVTRMEYENGALVERPARRHPFTVLGEVK